MARYPNCERMQAQNEMFRKVCDTIQKSSHLVILSHNVVWDKASGLPSLNERANDNQPSWKILCDPYSRFQDTLYSRLIEVRQRGVEVLFISGDYGQKEKSFEQQCNNGIWFIGSGIDRSNRYMPDSIKDTAKDKVLFLQHDVDARTLDWQFLDLDSLSSL